MERARGKSNGRRRCGGGLGAPRHHRPQHARPGSTAKLLKLIAKRQADVEIALNPEFTRQGSAVSDFLQPDRLVFGLTVAQADLRALPLLRHVYERVATKTVVTDAASAEMIKIASNVFLALKAGYANELARLSAQRGPMSRT